MQALTRAKNSSEELKGRTLTAALSQVQVEGHQTDLLQGTKVSDVLPVSPGQRDADALQGLNNILEAHISALHGNLLPAEGIEELVAIVEVLNSSEAAGSCVVGKTRRSARKQTCGWYSPVARKKCAPLDAA